MVLIEDNHDSREMLQAMLRLDGYRVESAEDGQKGLDTILQERPDIAVIDVGLPLLDGYEVARRVRQRFSKSEVLLVALTGCLRGMVGTERLSHRHRHCLAAKASTMPACLRFDVELIQPDLAHQPQGMIRCCHAKVKEACLGHFHNGRLTWVMFARC